MSDKWFICVPAAPHVYTYDTKEEMLAASSNVIQENYLDGDSGWSEEVHFAFGGFGYVKESPVFGCAWNSYEEYLKTKMTHIINEEIIDRKENYPQDDEDAEEWPYGDDFDYIASYDFVEKPPTTGEK